MKLLIFIFVIAATSTGILGLLLGDVATESLVLCLLGMVFLFALITHKIAINRENTVLFSISIFSLLPAIFNTLNRIQDGQLPIGVVFLMYPYLLILLMFFRFSIGFREKLTPFYSQILLWMICANCFTAIMQYLFNPAFLPMEGGDRATGLMRSTLNYSNLIASSFFLLVHFQSKKNRSLKLVPLILIIGILVSQSRGAVFSVIFGLMSLILTRLIQSNSIRLPRYKSVVIAPVLFLLLFVISTPFHDRLMSSFRWTSEASNAGRITAWTTTIAEISRNPIGFGIGTVGSPSGRLHNFGQSTESFWLQIPFEIGWIGVTFIILPLIALFKSPATSLYTPIKIAIISQIYIQNAIQQPFQTPAVISLFVFSILMTDFKDYSYPTFKRSPAQ